jgi:hypothetical protein
MTQYVLTNMSEIDSNGCTDRRLHLVSAAIATGMPHPSRVVSAVTLAGMQAEGDTFTADNRDARIVPCPCGAVNEYILEV